MISQDLADALWRRILPHLKAEDIANLVPLGWATEGTWLPVALNECFLFSGYDPGAYFRPHFDGMYINPYGECSIFTLTVYLNDDFEGGRLLFRAEPEKCDGGVFSGSARLKNQPIIASFRPRRGTALVFNHDTLHEGEKVKKGTKFIFRTSMMFRKVEDLTPVSRPFESDPVWQQAKAIFASFDALMAARDPKAFTCKFLEAQRLQLSHGRCLRAPPQSIPLLDVLPWELLDFTLLFLDTPRDLCSFMSACKALKAVVRRGSLWRQLYINRWGRDTLTLLENSFKRERAPPKGSSATASTLPFVGGEEKKSLIDPDLMDWLGLFRKRFVIEKGLVPVVIYPAELTHSSVQPMPTDPAVSSLPFPSRVFQLDCPWDASYQTMKLDEEDGRWFFSDRWWDDSRMEIDPDRFVFLCDQSLRNAGVSDVALCVMVLLSLPFTNCPAQHSNVPQEWVQNPADFGKDTGVTSRLWDVDEQAKRSIGCFMARTLHNVPALAFLDVELCALSICHSSSGVVAFEYHLCTRNRESTIWRVVRFREGRLVQETTHWRSVSNTDPSRLVQSICQLQEAAGAEGTHMPVVIGRDAEIDGLLLRYDDCINRSGRQEFAMKLSQQLLEVGLEVREVTPEDILKGARIAMGLPWFGETVQPTATLLVK